MSLQNVIVEIVRELKVGSILTKGSSYIILRKARRSIMKLPVGTVFKAQHNIVLKNKDIVGLVKFQKGAL